MLNRLSFSNIKQFTPFAIGFCYTFLYYEYRDFKSWAKFISTKTKLDDKEREIYKLKKALNIYKQSSLFINI